MPNYSHGLVLVLEKVGGPTRLAEQLGIEVAPENWTGS
jgi:hypothetical protein